MACSVEAITTNAILFIILVWNCIQICLSWHALSKCSIKYCYLRYAWHSCLTCFNTNQVCRIVQRSEVKALSDNLLNILIYNDRIGIDGSKLTHKPTGKEDYVVESPMKDHKIAVKLVLDALTDKDHGVIADIKEISAVGHRVLHAGQVYSDSIVVNEDCAEVRGQSTL